MAIPGVRYCKDQMRREVRLDFPPQRVISLVPSITELLLDLEVHVVGRTKFCIHPQSLVKNIQVIGGTKNFRFDTIRQLAPDLIIGNKEENYPKGISQLETEFPVWMSDIYDLADAKAMIRQLGDLLDRRVQSEAVLQRLAKKLHSLENSHAGRIIYLIWKDPWIAVGQRNYIHAFLTHLGYENLISGERYPEISRETIVAMNPDKVLLSTEPYPFKPADVQEWESQGVAAELVNGEWFSWYGTRLLK